MGLGSGVWGAEGFGPFGPLWVSGLQLRVPGYGGSLDTFRFVAEVDLQSLRLIQGVQVENSTYLAQAPI